MKRWQIASTMVIAAVVAAALYVGLFAPEASAHGGYEAGDYEIVFGWQVEPAYAGIYNGPEMTITDATTEEPVVGAEENLELSVTFGGKTKALDLRPAWNEPGRYVAYLTPTRPGDYVFELTGTISTTDAITPTVVNLTFDSADGEFSSIEPASDLLFPDTTADIISLQRQIDTLKKQIEELTDEVAALSEEE